MSIIKPHKLGVIAGPGSEYFTGKVVKHLRRLYIDRYEKVSKALSKRHSISEEELLEKVTLLDDLDSKKIPTGKLPSAFYCPDVTINVKYTRFANGEEKAELIDPVRGLNVYIIHDVSNSAPIKVAGLDEPQPISVNDHLMFLFTTIDAVKLAGAASITLVLPTYPYARQHKKGGREALTASMFARFCEGLGVERIITLDIHSREIENAFSICHLENLHGSYQTLIALRKVIDLSDPDRRSLPVQRGKKIRFRSAVALLQPDFVRGNTLFSGNSLLALLSLRSLFSGFSLRSGRSGVAARAAEIFKEILLTSLMSGGQPDFIRGCSVGIVDPVPVDAVHRGVIKPVLLADLPEHSAPVVSDRVHQNTSFSLTPGENAVNRFHLLPPGIRTQKKAVRRPPANSFSNRFVRGLFAVHNRLVAAVDAENIHDLLIHPAHLRDLGIGAGRVDRRIAAREKTEHRLTFGFTDFRILHLSISDSDRKIDARVDESERERRRASGEDHKRRQGNCCDNRFEFHGKLLWL